MAISQNQRLRRNAEKAARRKLVVAQKHKAEIAEAAEREARQLAEAARAPIESCEIAEEIFSLGLGSLVLARALPSGLIGASFFLVDVWSLGVKDAYFEVMTREDFEDQMELSSLAQPLVDIDPPKARKFLHDAVAYAASLGCAPARGFVEAEKIFGDIAMADDTFEFGVNGKPFLSPAR
jgi:cell division septum initiation protein DivIVA